MLAYLVEEVYQILKA